MEGITIRHNTSRISIRIALKQDKIGEGRCGPSNEHNQYIA